MISSWLNQHVTHLVKLGSLPFDRLVHEQFFTSIGWIVSREEWWDETCFEIQLEPIDRRLIGVYEDSETSIGLYALADIRSKRDYYLTSPEEFDCQFEGLLEVMRSLMPSAPGLDTYHCMHSPHEFKVAYWQCGNTTVLLVQHSEGDGHCGHDASPDIRIIPHTEPVSFPLTTDILF